MACSYNCKASSYFWSLSASVAFLTRSMAFYEKVEREEEGGGEGRRRERGEEEEEGGGEGRMTIIR